MIKAGCLRSVLKQGTEVGKLAMTVNLRDFTLKVNPTTFDVPPPLFFTACAAQST